MKFDMKSESSCFCIFHVCCIEANAGHAGVIYRIIFSIILKSGLKVIGRAVHESQFV